MTGKLHIDCNKPLPSDHDDHKEGRAVSGAALLSARLCLQAANCLARCIDVLIFPIFLFTKAIQLPNGSFLNLVPDCGGSQVYVCLTTLRVGLPIMREIYQLSSSVSVDLKHFLPQV